MNYCTHSNILHVADTSVVINLIATQCSEAILEALPNHVVVLEESQCEISRGKEAGHNTADGLEELVSNGHIDIVELGETGREWFRKLVSGPSVQSLGDGEAATISYAIEEAVKPLLDDRKAINACSERFPNLNLGSSMHILAGTNVQEALGQKDFANALFNALRFGRMRLSNADAHWVASLIGPERARDCPSLPKSFQL